MVLDQGHEQPVSTTIDGRFAEIVEMPHSSPWPLLLGLGLGLVFGALVLNKYGIAGIFAVLCVLTLFAWHSQEPQEG
jgi:uncharacterized membrane protein YccC